MMVFHTKLLPVEFYSKESVTVGPLLVESNGFAIIIIIEESWSRWVERRTEEISDDLVIIVASS